MAKDLAKRKEEREKRPVDVPKVHKINLPFDKFDDVVKFNGDLEPIRNNNGDLVQTKLMVHMVSET